MNFIDGIIGKLYNVVSNKIKKSGVDFTMTSEQSEDLPLPHTKGTKPAPSTFKVKV